MSNHKHAYGWMGHIITSKEETDSDPAHNLIAIPRLTFERLVSDFQNIELDERIEVEQLGLIADLDPVYLACGYAFSTGFEYYGTIFTEAEMLEGGNESVSRKDQERPYLEAMKEIYGLELPPSKLMVGCSSEH